jgi:hypothetical protein
MADGHLNKCKLCTKTDVKNHRFGPYREKILAYDRKRSKTDHRKQSSAIRNKNDYQKFKKRRQANQLLRRAILKGLVKKWPVCFVHSCNKRPEGHHPDYSKPLDVVWLCPEHHRQAHALIYDYLQLNKQT